MSKNEAYGEPGPFSSTSSHQACLAGPDPHVIGNDVENLSHPVRPQLIAEGVVVSLVANLGIEGIWIDDVISVRSAGAGLHVGGGVGVADSQLREIRHDFAGVAEGERVAELQPIGRFRDRGRGNAVGDRVEDRVDDR